jgi:VanZ family protein
VPLELVGPKIPRDGLGSASCGANNGSAKMSVERILKLCGGAVLILLVFVALGPAKWAPRSGFGWEIDHFVGYFVITLMLCFAWPRPLVVGGGLVVFAASLEALQALTPDRSSNVFAALYSACGVVLAAVIAGLFIQARTRFRRTECAGEPKAGMSAQKSASPGGGR